MRSIPTKSLLFLSFLVFLMGCQSSRQVKSGEENLDIVVLLNKKALSYYFQKRYKKAREIYFEIVKIASNDLTKYQEALAWSYYDIGFSYLVQKKYKTAFNYFELITKEYDQYLDVFILSKDRIKEIEIRTKGNVKPSSQ